MRGPADVTAVVVTYNSAHVVDGLLDSLPAALDGLSVRTIVVDNSSTDHTLDVLHRRSDCEVVSAPNLGYAAGINRGVAAAPGDSPILVLNPDVRLTPGSVRTMRDALTRPGIGIVGPKVVDAEGTLVPSMRREPSLTRAVGLERTGLALFSERVIRPERYEHAQTCDWALGAVLLVSRECHTALAGWDESFFLYSEETDFCLRARDQGWGTWYEPAAVVTHIGGQSGVSARIHAMQILNRVRVYRRRHGLPAGAAYHLLCVASELSWLLRGQRFSRAAVEALLRRSRRPAELGLPAAFIPR